MRNEIECSILSNALTIVEKLLLEGYQVKVTRDHGVVCTIDYTKEELGGSFEYVGDDQYIATYETEEESDG